MDAGMLLLIEVIFAVLLLFVNVFRFNLLFVIAGIAANVAIVMNVNAPDWMHIGASALALGELLAGSAKALKEKRGMKV